MRWHAKRCALGFALVVLGIASSAVAAEHALVLTSDEGGCPSRSAVVAELEGIFPGIHVLDGDVAPEILRAEVRDAGPSYRVSAGGMERQFVDDAGQCDERARKAAVFIALALDPPAVQGLAPPSPPVTPRPAAPAATLPPAASRLSVEVEVAGLVDAAPRSGTNSLLSVGGVLRLFVGGENLGGAIGVSALTPAVLELVSDRARVTRVPIDLAARGRLRRGRWTVALDLGVVMAVQLSEGLDVAPVQTETRLELGLRAAARLERWQWKRIALFVAVQAEWVPSPSNFTLPEAGVIGTAPQGWIGFLIGLALRLR